MRFHLPLCAIAVSSCLISSVQAETIISTGFEEGSFAATGLFDFSSITVPVLNAGAGANGTTALNFGSDGAAASASRTIDATTHFTMFGRYNGNAGTDSGTMSFGWTNSATDFNPYSGGASQVIVGVARTAGNGFRLGAVNGSHQNLTGGALFGTSAASLTNGNWYRLEGTILYNSGTGQFTFNNISLDDFGATGASQVTADILSGTGATVTNGSFGTTGRAVFMTNRDRGFELTDNYSAVTPVPEPASLAAFGIGTIGLLAMWGLRRRRAKLA